MMQAQNAALFLGQIPNPQTGEGEVNLPLAKMFIDQLGMIQEKTRGNLSNEEATVLKNTISNLQMAFVEVSQSEGAAGMQRPQSTEPAIETPRPPVVEQPPQKTPVPPGASPETSSATPAAEGESRKKFTKSYGA